MKQCEPDGITLLKGALGNLVPTHDYELLLFGFLHKWLLLGTT